MNAKGLTATLGAAVLIAGCAPRAPEPAAAPVPEPDAVAVPARVDALADAYVAAFFERFPEAATSEGIEGADHGELTDHSLDALASWHARQDEFMARLRAIDRAAVAGTRAAVTYAFLEEVLEADIGARVCRLELWTVSPTYTGWQVTYPFLASIQPVGTPELRDAAVERFSALDDWIRVEIGNLREGLRLGYSEPRHNVLSVIEQIDALLAADPTSSPFYNPAVRDSTPAFQRAMRRVVTDDIRPALREYRAFLADEYAPRARRTIAVAANPDGDACYRAAVRYHTSLTIPPEEIHRTGLEQMAVIRSQMQEVARRGFGSDDVAAVLQRLKTDPEFTFDSREHLLDYARAAVARAEAEVPDWFGLVPRADVVVRPYPTFQEKNAPGGEYNAPSDDLTRPGVYRINLYEAEKQSIAGVESTVFHETYPGHHLQIGIAKERPEIHPVQKYFGTSGFSEGWALYAERLAEEMGLFSGDVDVMGLLSNEALRAARLVVDAGMHQLGWTRQRAIDYILAHTTETEARATAEVDRYIAVPGQATAYMLGALKIQELRRLAENRLGEDFDIREFHDRVVEDGAVTLSMLETKIGDWIR